MYVLKYSYFSFVRKSPPHSEYSICIPTEYLSRTLGQLENKKIKIVLLKKVSLVTNVIMIILYIGTNNYSDYKRCCRIGAGGDRTGSFLETGCCGVRIIWVVVYSVYTRGSRLSNHLTKRPQSIIIILYRMLADGHNNITHGWRVILERSTLK